MTALITAGVLTVTWLGDSRAALGFEDADGKMRAEFLTVDHKPDQPAERARIEASGGSVEYLHNNFNKARLPFFIFTLFFKRLFFFKEDRVRVSLYFL